MEFLVVADEAVKFWLGVQEIGADFYRDMGEAHAPATAA
jgi:hypothetical protein